MFLYKESAFFGEPSEIKSEFFTLIYTISVFSCIKIIFNKMKGN